VVHACVGSGSTIARYRRNGGPGRGTWPGLRWETRTTISSLAVDTLELVGIAHGVHGGDPPIANLERERLHLAVVIDDDDEPRHAVDARLADGLRRRQRTFSRQSDKEADDLVPAADGIERRRPLPAAIGMEDGVLGQKLCQARHIAGQDRRVERVRQPDSIRQGRGKPRPRLPHMRARTRRQLPARGFVPVARLGDLDEVQLEDVAQEERRAIERRQAFERTPSPACDT
jgi:hypothetical protein